MLRKNFPGRVKARRIDALTRLQALSGAVNVGNGQYAIIAGGLRQSEQHTLAERIQLGAPARGNNGKGKRPRAGRRRAIA